MVGDLRAGVAGQEHLAHPRREVGDQAGPPRGPRLRRGGAGVGLGQRLQQVEGLHVGHRVQDVLDRARVVEVARGGRLGRAAGAGVRATGPARTPARRTRSGRRPRRRSARRPSSGRRARPCRCRGAGRRRRARRARHPPDQPARLDAGLDQVPVHGEAVHDRGVRQQPDPVPLGQHPVQGTGLVEGLPHRQQAGAGGEQPGEQLPGLGGPRLGHRHAFAVQAGGGGRREHQAALGGLRGRAQEQQRVARGAGAAVQHDLAARDRDAARDPPQVGRRGGRPAVGGRASTASTRPQVSRDRWVIRRPSSRTCRWAASRVGQPQPPARSGHASGSTRSPARPASRCTTSRTSSSCSRLGSRSECETSTSQVATSALSTVASRSPPTDSFRSGTERVRQLARATPPPVHQLAQRRAAARARRAASARAGRRAAAASARGRPRGAVRRAARARPAGRRERCR